jgi:hypothetical protein
MTLKNSDKTTIFFCFCSDYTSIFIALSFTHHEDLLSTPLFAPRTKDCTHLTSSFTTLNSQLLSSSLDLTHHIYLYL